MVLCHGNGNLDTTDGCCWVAGEPCPLRWKIVDGHIIEGPNNSDRGLVNDHVEAAYAAKSQTARNRIKALLQGTTYICKAATEVLSDSPRFLTDRPGFNEAWNSHPDYVALVRPHWEQIEDNLGLARGEYQCSSWQGTARLECCFSEDEAVNSQKASSLSVTAVQIRERGGR